MGVSGVGAALEISHLTKSYGANRALDDVSLIVRPGTVHGLVGGNGSGKSTMIKILAGVLKPDGGSVTVFGRELLTPGGSIGPAEVRAAQLRFVHQQNSVFPALSVAENLALGASFEQGRFGAIHWRAQRRHASAVLERFRIRVRPGDLVDTISPANQALIAIARALQDVDPDEQPGVLLLDEPTASLPRSEVQVLLEALRELAQQGQSIVFVSHRLDEILSVTDTLTVLRDGRIVHDGATRDLDHDGLVTLIAGRDPRADMSPRQRPPSTADVPRLTLRGLSGGGLRGANFTVMPGEIVGIGGLLGSGRSSLLRVLFGVTPRSGGSVAIDGRLIEPRHPRQAMDLGLAYVPEDRASESVFLDLSVMENLSVASLGSLWGGLHLKTRVESKAAQQAIIDYGIKCRGPRNAMFALSGGNQQKAILARWLRRRPTLLLLDEPTHGVDVGARAEIYGLIREAAAEGTAVLVVSSDAEELEELCDRVLAIRNGFVTDEVAVSASTGEVIEGMV